MSISKMDWSRRNANGAVAHPNNQQYLPQSTSSSVQTMPSHKTPNTYSPTQTFSTNSVSHNHILKSLLGASSIEEIAQIQLSALSNTTGQQSLQISQAQYNALFSSQQKMTTATNQQNSHGGQNPVISNYQLQIYPDSVLQNFQQTQLGQQLVVQQQTQPMHFLQQIIQQQAQPMQQARPKPNVQQQTLPMLQPKPNVQQQTQPMQQPMPNVQQQTQPMQQPMPIVQQQTQPMQQARHMSIVQQPQVMPFVQQQAQTMQLPFVQQAQTMQQPVAQQQAQPMQQPQSMPVGQQQAQPGQCYNIRINNGEIQQAPQSTQSGGYSHKNSQKAMKTYSRKRYSQNVQTSYQSMPQPNGQAIYSSPNGNSVQYVASYKANVPVSTSNYQNGQNVPVSISNYQNGQNVPVSTSNYQNGQNVPVSTSNYQNGQNVPVSTSNYQNGQNVPVSTSNYQNGQNVPVSTSDCQNGQNVPVSTSNYQNGQNIQNQMGSNFQTNTLQLQRDVNDYIQSPQRQVMPSLHSGFANNSSNVLPSATVGQMPPLYSQSTTNASNVCNVSVNQRLPNPSQNVGAQNVQQPEQSYSAPQDPHSVSVPPPANFGNVPQDPRSNVQNILALLKVYRNVKLKYLMLNRENNLLRQKMLSSPQDNSGPVKPPLISILSESTVPSNNPIGGKEVSPNSTVQSRPPSNTHGVQTPPLYNDHLNVPVQNIDQSSNSFSSHGHSANSDLLNQRNNTGQMNLGSNANSSGQAVGSGTLRDQGHQEISMGSVQANKQYFSQDGLHVTSIQSVDQTTKSSESCNPVHAASASNFYSNKPLTFSSREAIKATLPLWKSVSQSSTQSEYSEPKQPTVDGLNAIQILEEMASHPINESSAVTLTQKSEHSGPNASKGVEPQIAIVSPLVQIKDLANDIRRHSKVVQQGEDLANNGVSGVKGNDQFNKLLQSLESDDARLRSSMVFSSPCSIEVSSNCNVDQSSAKNIETDDDSLQISGVCTLVEGNSSYDSSIALMFEGSLQTRTGTPMAKTDLNDEHTLQCSQEDINIGDALQAASSFSPSTEVIAVKSEPEEEIEPQVNIEDDLQGENVCLQAQPENNLPAADVFDLESDTVSDQLSELLTEFPFGIKNYMSEEKSTEVSLRKYTAKTEFPKTSMSFSFDGESESIEDMQIENAMDTLTKEIEPSRTEDTDQQCMVERAPIDEGNSTQLEDDCFEVCDSPEDNIHITLLDQDQINKLFPEDSTEPIVNSEESLVKSCEKDSEAPVVDNAVNAIKEKSETVSVAHKELFCCLFSWLTHTNGNAPKCNCKLAELSETKDLTSSFLEPVAMIKTEPSADVDEPFREDLDSPTNGLKPSFSDPCKTKLDEIKNAEILPPVLKRPKLEPIECPIESKTDQDIVNPQKGIQANEYLPEKKNHEDQSLKDLRTYYTLTNEKVIQSKSLFEDPMSMESNDPFVHSDSKDDGPPKLEKLIIKTDFLKNKHLSKMKKKYKERKMSRVEEGGSRNVSKNYESTEMFESARTYYIDRSAKVGNEKFNPLASTVQQPEKGMSKLKSSSSSDKSHSHSQAPSLDKRRGRRKKQPESHFEKVKNVPTVQEYLERKRELCNKRPVSKVDEREETPEVRHRVVEKHSMEKTGNDLLMKLLTNQPKRGRPKNIGGSQPLFKKHSHEKGSLVNKGSDQKSTFYRDKIYLSPCDVSRLASCEGINLTKLQIRRSPEKPAYDERRKSLESYVPNEQKKEAPKMLEFKLCPEFDHRNPTTQERKGEPKPVTEKSIVEGIKSKKEAWCSGGPGRKSWIDGSSEEQGNHSPSQSTSSIQSSSQKSSSRTVQDSKATFNAFKQLYHEQRSKSLDHSL